MIRRIEESINIKSTRVEGVPVGRDRGLRRPGARRRRLGLRRQPPPVDRRGGPRRRRGRPDREGQRDGPAARPWSSTSGRRPSGRFETPVEEDPFAVPLDRKIADLLAADRAMNAREGHRVHREPVLGPARVEDVRRQRRQLTPSRSSPTSARAWRPTRSTGDEHQRRSYPDNGGLWASAGYEFVRGDGPRGATPSGSRARPSSCSARPPLPAGTRTIVLHPSQLYMQVHESCGHPTELDRAFGTEASYAGTSFLTPDMLGTFRYGSDLVRHRRRRDRRRAASARSAGTTRASRPSGCRSSRRACSSAT